MIDGYSEEIEKEIIDLIDRNVAPIELNEIVDSVLPVGEDEDSEELEYEIDAESHSRTSFVSEILYQSYLIVSMYGKKNYYWTTYLLEQFIENSITSYFKSTHKTLKHATVIECHNRVLSELKVILYGDSTLNDIKDSEISFSYFFYEDFNGFEYLLSKILDFLETDKRFFIKRLPDEPENLQKALVYFTDEDVVKKHQLLILGEIGKLLSVNNNAIWLNNLIFRLNTTDLDTVFARPFSRHLVLNIINLFPEYLNINKEVIIGNRDVDTIVNGAIQDSTPFDKVDLPNHSGIIFFVFNGEEYPFENAIEYIKLRPIIYSIKCDDCKDFLKTFHETDNELSVFLTALFGEAENVENWLLRNIRIGVYEDYLGIRNIIAAQIIFKYSPVFNLADNPGNLFYTTLSKHLKCKTLNAKESLKNE